MRRVPPSTPALFVPLLLFFLTPAAPSHGGDDPYVLKYLAAAHRHEDQGDLPAARKAAQRVLEWDDQNLEALRLVADASAGLKETDEAVHAYHRWLDLAENAPKGEVPRSSLKAVQEALAELDPQAGELRQMSRDFVRELRKLASAYSKKKLDHSALAVYQMILAILPGDKDALKNVRLIRTRGGDELASADLFAGGDPTFGVTGEWIEKQDARHSDWKHAWKEETANYRFQTDAGYMVMKTAALAMDQMNRFYRKFFQFRTDGSKTPKIEILIFKNRDEYLKHNGLPQNDWTGGFFNGGSVQTFVGGSTGRAGIREMYRTLFHEAAHQFVDLTGRGGVPGWLNEAYASFFEGTTILSNGSVNWNQVAQHRLFPLASRMEKGWMKDYRDGVRDSQGEWASPERAPTFRILVEDRYEWGPPWYAPTWGVVYFLYNNRDDTGQLIYRKALHDFYESAAAGRGDPVSHFEEVVLKGSPLSPVADIDGLNDIWRNWILGLRDVQLGRKPPDANLVDFGDRARERGDLDAALEFFEEAHTYRRSDPEVIWRLAGVLEEKGRNDRAVALYRDFSREMELRGATEDPRYAQAGKKADELDPLHAQQERILERFKERGMKLARSYQKRELPLMAMEVARKLSASFSIPEALDLYEEIARKSGKSLARWKVAYDEFDLRGWAGSPDYRPYGTMIEASVKADPTLPGADKGFATSQLFCDVAFESDFSLETKIQFTSQATLGGLVFGQKDDLNFDALVLHPKGFLDLSTNHGGAWSILDHRSVHLLPDWNKLRIDVVGNKLDIYLNGRYLRSFSMPDADSLRGGFGLVTGVGTAYYQDIRLLPRDPHDPAARIEREIGLQDIEEDPGLRESGSFAGLEPPDLQVREWIQGKPVELEELHGRPAVLIFWTPAQDELIPTTAYYRHLAAAYHPLGVEFLALSESAFSADKIRDYLGAHPMPGVRVARDSGTSTYRAYNVTKEGWHLPRILLIDVDGKVVWEGDPGFRIGTGWPGGENDSYLDGPLRNLVQKRHMKELVQFSGAEKKGSALLEKGDFAAALETLAPLADLDADFDPGVRQARQLQNRIIALADGLPREAEKALEAGWPLRAEALLKKALEGFPGSSTANLARSRLARLRRDARYRQASKAWKLLGKAVRDAAHSGNPDKIGQDIDAAAAASDLPEITAAVGDLRQALRSGGGAALASRWPRLQPAAGVSVP